MIHTLTPEDVRAARELLKWSQDDLATAARVSVSAVADFETAARKPHANDLDAIKRALERAYIVFTPNGPAIYDAVELCVMTEERGATIGFRYPQGQPAAVHEIISIFGAVDGELAVDQLVTSEMLTALDELVTRSSAAVPQLNELKQMIRRVGVGKHFLLLPHMPDSTKTRIALDDHLRALNHPEAAPSNSLSQDLFGTLLDLYDVRLPRTDRKTVLGTGDRPRRCRFCHRTAGDTSFKKVAHVIPAALGNDHLKSAEECDECNEYFGRETEPSLIGILDVPRAYLGTQGRGSNNGRPKLKFGKDTLLNDGQTLEVRAHTVSTPDANTVEVALGPGARLVPMAIYRALVKIVVSVIDAKHLPDLIKTIEWVRHGRHADRPVPKVQIAIVNLPPNPSAQIQVYIRRTKHPRLPHVVGEFSLGCYVMVFAVPFSAQGQWDLVGFFDDPDFKNTFRHYMADAEWRQWDLSSTKHTQLSPRLNFVRH